LPTILTEIEDSNSPLTKAYFYTDGQPLVQYSYNEGAEPNEPSDAYYYIHDRLGSIRQVIDVNGTVVTSNLR